MYISAKTNNTTRNFIKGLLERNISIEVREHPTLTFIEAKLEGTNYSAYLPVHNGVLSVVDQKDIDAKRLNMDLANLDCIFEL